MKLKELRSANIARAVEWGPRTFNPLFRAAELGGEVGEALNVVKKIERAKLDMVGSRATWDDLKDEIADVIIAADLLAMEYGIDLSLAVREKFNKTSGKYGLETKL